MPGRPSRSTPSTASSWMRPRKPHLNLRVCSSENGMARATISIRLQYRNAIARCTNGCWVQCRMLLYFDLPAQKCRRLSCFALRHVPCGREHLQSGATLIFSYDIFPEAMVAAVSELVETADIENMDMTCTWLLSDASLALFAHAFVA